MMPIRIAILVALATGTSAFGCTTNVEDPVVNQTGRTGDTCVQSCDNTQTECMAKCTDDTCKAACETTHTSCTSKCTPKDGG
jgi:hypothetical protein